MVTYNVGTLNDRDDERMSDILCWRQEEGIALMAIQKHRIRIESRKRHEAAAKARGYWIAW